MSNSWILAHVESGSAYLWGAGGEWWSEAREEYIKESNDLDVMLEMEDDVAELAKVKDVFRVLLEGVSFVVEEGGWGYYGYDPSSAHIEYNSAKIVAADFEMEEPNVKG